MRAGRAVFVTMNFGCEKVGHCRSVCETICVSSYEMVEETLFNR